MMDSLHNLIRTPFYLLLTNPYIGVGLLVVVGILFKPTNLTKRKECPYRIQSNRLKGANRSLSDQLEGSHSAVDKLDLERKQLRSALVEARRRTSYLESKVKSRSLYLHQLERKLLKYSRR
ncbi:hypothetical protein KQH40_00300 [bacterium]|nr:hypothetical protein [bacterium]